MVRGRERGRCDTSRRRSTAAHGDARPPGPRRRADEPRRRGDAETRRMLLARSLTGEPSALPSKYTQVPVCSNPDRNWPPPRRSCGAGRCFSNTAASARRARRHVGRLASARRCARASKVTSSMAAAPRRHPPKRRRISGWTEALGSRFGCSAMTRVLGRPRQGQRGERAPAGQTSR